MAQGDATGLGTSFEFEPGAFVSGGANFIDSSHVVIAWEGPANDGYVDVLAVDGDGQWSRASSGSVEFDTVSGVGIHVVAIDSTHAVMCWGGAGTDFYAGIVTIDGSYNPTVGTLYEILDATTATDFDLTLIDSTHVLVFYNGTPTNDGIATVLTWDGSYVVSEVTASGANPYIVATYGEKMRARYLTSDGSYWYYVANYNTAASASCAVRMLRVSKSNYAVDCPGSAYTIDSSTDLGQGGTFASVYAKGLAVIDSTHFIAQHAYTTTNGVYDHYRVFSVNTSTGALTLGDTDLNNTSPDVGAGHVRGISAITSSAFASCGYRGTKLMNRLVTVDGSYNITLFTPSEITLSGTSVSGSVMTYAFLHTATTGRIAVLYADSATSDGFIKSADIDYLPATSTLPPTQIF